MFRPPEPSAAAHQMGWCRVRQRLLGDESTLVINPGASEDTVYGFARSGRANIRVRIEGDTTDAPSGAQATVTATLKRLQQLQDNKAATVTAPDEQFTSTN
ncbi:hypothetical protein ACFYQ5_23685 [Streptomyces sp. NPDC005794]|uniref:hypothetical protein n=1 Tax=Streptomyces sp. NPDC005794 TaxID=3364733 RepID=UPI0036C33285